MNERDPKEIWSACLKILKDLVTPQIYSSYFEPLEIVEYNGKDLLILVPSEHYRQYIEDKLIAHLRRALHKVLGKNVSIYYRIKMGNSGRNTASPRYPATPQYPRRNQNVVVFPTQETQHQRTVVARNITVDPQLQTEFCFEYLIKGEGNMAAYKACKNVIAEYASPRTKLPLYFFGNTGVGKTHLIQSLGLEFRKLFPNKVVQYITANQFTQQFTEVCARKKKGEKEAINDFEILYESINMLVIDDIQELAGRYATQDFLLNIIERMQQNAGQLILASTQPPAYLTGFRESLLSRLKSGPAIQIVHLDKAKRAEILRERAQRDGIEDFPEDVIEYIAQYIKSNVRELIGVYLSLIANATFAQKTITLELAQEVMTQIVGERALTKITLDDIKSGIAKIYKLRIDELCENTRRANIVEPRQIAMYLAIEHTSASLAAIGQNLGKRSHSTVLHAAKTIRDRMDSSKEFREKVENIKKELHISD